MSTALIDLTVLSSPSRRRGIGRYAADLGRALAARSRPGDVAVRAVELLPWMGPAIISDDAAAVVSHLSDGPATSTHPAWAWRVRLRLASAARWSGADVVHSPHPDATPALPLGCPRIVTCHDLIDVAYAEHYATWRDGWAAGRRYLDAQRYRRADHVIAVSEATADDLLKMLSIPPRRITVVRNGIDLTRFSPSPQADDGNVLVRLALGERPFLLYIGGADWRKNAAGMFDVLAALGRRLASDAPILAWAGYIHGRDLARVRQLAADRGVADRVRLLGWVPDAMLAALLRRAAALLFVSRAEGFGYPMIEAMASGCPVVSGRHPAALELAGDAALLVDLDRPAPIADAVSALLRDATERRRLIDGGLTRARAFDVARMADETLDVYRRVIAGRP